MRFAIESLSFVYTVPGNDGKDRVYVIRRGRVRAEMDAPGSVAEQSALDALLREAFGDAVDGMQLPSHEIDELLLLSSWFKRFPQEMERTQPVPRAS